MSGACGALVPTRKCVVAVYSLTLGILSVDRVVQHGDSCNA